MALDGKILVRARKALEKKRIQNEERIEQRLEKVYAEVPRIRILDTELRVTMVELVGAALGADAGLQVENIKLKNLELQEERQRELIRAGFSEYYLSDEYMCTRCNDTGYIDSKMCQCLKNLYDEEQRASLSNLFKLGTETFDNFDITYYADTPASDTGISPRRSMEVVYETCVEYARKFGSKSMNLLFTGAPGLGKTFLSACIARVVAENGFSVVYDTASSIFARFEDIQFQRTDDPDGVRNEINRYLECDLLIIDDLGTEMTTSFTISSLYEIVNTRLVNSRKTLISSNLTPPEMHRRYSEQIMSRLEWEYQVLKFYGDDIRKKKNAV